jgi:predicted GH43/DUF377 family glycosyl hydrolase
MNSRVESLILARDRDLLRPDPRRVIARLFVPGHEQHLINGQSRLTPVLERILALSPETAAVTLAVTLERFGRRHRDLRGLLSENFELVAHRIGAAADLPEATRLLVGSYFTHEYSIEAAALFNPSILIHPDQGGVAAGEVRVLLSLRAVGEGHWSSIEFRTGVIGAQGRLRIDEPPPHLLVGRQHEATFRQHVFHAVLGDLGDDGEDAAFILDALPDPFTAGQLDAALVALRDQEISGRSVHRTILNLRWIASCNYEVRFEPDSALSQRVLVPVAPTESNGMEDARFVRFVDDDATVSYYATYTAYDGRRVAPQMLQTDDFLTFRSAQLTGPAAVNKGMALFPRRINGRFVALSRWDRENNSITTSADAHNWSEGSTIQTPRQPWELIQIGNCGSPIETDQGWLVLTHGVGPMRSYGIGAMLLDLDDPTKLIGELPEPLITPDEAERDGYVPNVVYTCGALAVADRLVVPYGSADSSVGAAVFDLPGLLDQLTSDRG